MDKKRIRSACENARSTSKEKSAVPVDKPKSILTDLDPTEDGLGLHSVMPVDFHQDAKVV